MVTVRLSKSLCAVVGDAIATTGSHATLDQLFIGAGVPGDPPSLAHHSKWKEWLFRAGQVPDTDSLAVLGNVLEEFMDLPPMDAERREQWKELRARVEAELEANGVRYYRFGRVLPQGVPASESLSSAQGRADRVVQRPESVEELLSFLVKSLRRAMHPLTHRRKGSTCLVFSSEYDVQDLLHALMRPWIGDIRPEEFTPSYAGTSTRMDFLLPAYSLVVEMKIVRDRVHAKKIGEELIIDIEHYKRHPDCKVLWCVIYDPEHFLTNAEGLRSDLEGPHSSKEGNVSVRVFTIQ